jgi:hypothetical protein
MVPVTGVYLEMGTRRELGPGRRPARFAARRAAWHALDHAWEIQGKAPAMWSRGPRATGVP